MNFNIFASMPWKENHEIKDKKNAWIIDDIYNGLLPHFVRKVIEQKEGSSCSGDKESFVIRKIKESIITGENQNLYSDYSGCKQIDKSRWEEKAYWSPTSFKDTDDVIAQFSRWYSLEDFCKEKEETSLETERE